MKRQALGKGLDALLPPVESTSGLQQLELEQIQPNPLQPRLRFSQESLEDLAQSIRENGLLQPVVVRRQGPLYELVAGERRWRAAQKAGLRRIPALIQDVSDQQMLELALVENLQRDDLNPLEEAQAYRILLEDFQLKQEEVARRVGRSRSAVTNTLRLLQLPKPLQQALLDGELSMGHARALLPLPRSQQLELAQKIIRQGWSVRETERRVRTLLERKPPNRSASADPHLQAAEQKLEELWQTRVEIRRRGQGGFIRLHFHSEEELQRLYEALTRA